MLIPLGTERSRKRPSVVTPGIIMLCVVTFLAQLLSRPPGTPDSFGVFDDLILDPSGRKWWTLATSLFLHADAWHLGGNMLFLWVFGTSVEDKFGRWWFALFYVMSGLASSGAHLLFSDSPALGASGAVAGVTGAFLVLFPWTHIRVLVMFFIIGVWSIPAWWLIGFAIARDFISLGAQTGIAHEAHLGGYFFGILLSMVLLWTKALPREPWDLFTIARQAKRRAAMKDAHRLHERRIKEAVGAKKSRGLPGPADPTPPPAEFPPEVRAARAQVAEKLGASDAAAAARAYRGLVERFIAIPGAILLGRGQQLAVGNALFGAGDHQTAARAYDAFLDAYTHDREAPSVRVMLGLINARYLNDPVRAKQVLLEAQGHVSGEQKDLVEELLKDLG